MVGVGIVRGFGTDYDSHPKPDLTFARTTTNLFGALCWLLFTLHLRACFPLRRGLHYSGCLKTVCVIHSPLAPPQAESKLMYSDHVRLRRFGDEGASSRKEELVHTCICRWERRCGRARQSMSWNPYQQWQKFHPHQKSKTPIHAEGLGPKVAMQ
jgi:hypothetical protein